MKVIKPFSDDIVSSVVAILYIIGAIHFFKGGEDKFAWVLIMSCLYVMGSILRVYKLKQINKELATKIKP